MVSLKTGNAGDAVLREGEFVIPKWTLTEGESWEG